MRLFWVYVTIVLSFLVYSHQEDSVSRLLSSKTTETVERAEENLLPGKISKARIRYHYALLKGAFTSAVQLDGPGQDKTTGWLLHCIFLDKLLSVDRFNFLIFRTEYADFMSVKYHAGFYLFFLKKLLI